MTPEERRKADGAIYRERIGWVVRYMVLERREAFLAGIRFAIALMKEDSPSHSAGASRRKEAVDVTES